MTVIQTIENYTYLWEIFAIILAICSGGFALFQLAKFKDSEDQIRKIIISIFGLILAILLGCYTGTAPDYLTYQVRFDEGTTIDEIIDHYEILEQVEDTFIIKAKE